MVLYIPYWKEKMGVGKDVEQVNIIQYCTPFEAGIMDNERAQLSGTCQVTWWTETEEVR